MLRKVPVGVSRLGWTTVTRPGLIGSLNCLWLPTWFTSNQPSALSMDMTSRLFVTCISMRTSTSRAIHPAAGPSFAEAGSAGLMAGRRTIVPGLANKAAALLLPPVHRHQRGRL